jgi:hypothetical protein
MRLPSPPVRMLSDNLPQAGVICALQMERVSVQMGTEVLHTWRDMPITGRLLYPAQQRAWGHNIPHHIVSFELNL